MMRTISTVCVLLLSAGPLVAGEKKNRSANQMMIDAHAIRSTWDKSFPGFTADLKATIDGKVVSGTVSVSADGDVKLKLPEGPIFNWARKELRSIVDHRITSVKEDYGVSFADKVTTHPLGRLIKFNKSDTYYRIRGNVITEVHRQSPAFKFIISVTEIARNKEGKLLPRHFNVSFWNPKTGDLRRNAEYREDWIRVGEFDLPQRRLEITTGNDGVRTVGEIRLSNHKLLSSGK